LLDFDLPYPPWDGHRIHILQEPEPERLVVVTGIFERDRLETTSVLRVSTGNNATGRAVRNAFVETVDANGARLDRTALRRLRTYACGCGCGGDRDDESSNNLVQALLPDI